MMTESSALERRRLFAQWLRTGRLPRCTSEDGRELKFNPWHDPANGRFTFSGAGGASEGRRAGDAVRGARRRLVREGAVAGAPAVSLDAAKDMARRQASRALSSTPRRPGAGGEAGGPVFNFVAGVGEGLYDTAKGAVSNTYALVTTNPVTTIRETNAGVAAMLDAAIAAEDTPAYRQIARAGQAVASASARDIGRVTGHAAGTVAIGGVTNTALSRVATLRWMKMAKVYPAREPPSITWSKETLKKGLPSTLYNDAAPGARPGLAPALMRRMPDGTTRRVKFDGIDGEYMIDRKWKVVNLPNARAQILRQSKVLAQNGVHGMWEVPTAAQRIKAFNAIKKEKVANIKVRVVEP
ncbi:hypothetical protein ACU5AX_04665 [Sphingomonas sp. XXL09]|uniref:hypothetical protein n=1 Tax=Sphingomonas sp. XXL09 TaxID=3457787 RepID=UPI00406BA4BC